MDCGFESHWGYKEMEFHTMKCSTCKKLKTKVDFTVDKTKTRGFSSLCRECKSDYNRKHYASNREKTIARVNRNNKAYKLRNREYVYQHLLSNPCVDCNETNVVVLEFDHLRDKDNGIAVLVAKAVSIKRLQTEMDNCEVRCANCHRRKTAIQFNWYKYMD